MEDLSLGFIPPPKHREQFASEPRPKGLPARKPPVDLKGLPPTPSINLSRYSKQGRAHHHHPQQKRQVSLPPQLLDHQEKDLHQMHDYTNIIQIYEENSPFRLLEKDRALLTPKTESTPIELSSPESNDSSISDSSSNSSSSYSFENSQEDDTLSIEPSVLNRLSQESLTEKPKLHPRDSIRLMRNYSEDHDKFRIKTKTPPVLPQHTINVIKKDAYYKSRASFEGEAQPHDPSIQTSPCNERDTSIFTRRSRRLPPLPAKDVPTSNQDFQDIPTFQLPGYQGGLRVVNRVPS